MAIEAALLAPPSFMTGDSVRVSDLKGQPAKFNAVDTRVQQGSNPDNWQLVFNLANSANPVRWTLKDGFTEADVDAALEEVLTIIEESVEVSS